MINQHLTSLAVALQDIDSDAPRLQSWGSRAAAVLVADGRLLACGTGESAQQAQHLAARLAHGEDDRPPLATAVLAAGDSAGEEGGSRQTLAEQVRARGRVGDILVCISAADPRSDLIAAATAARDIGLTVWALTGSGPDRLAAASDDAVSASAAAASTAQEVHLAAIHIFCAAVESAVRDAVRAADRRSAASGMPAGPSTPLIAAELRPLTAL